MEKYKVIIGNRIKELEKQNQIFVLFAGEGGSRAWGWNSDFSDFDIRFIYIHTLDWYFMIEEAKREVLDAVYSVCEDCKVAMEFHGWELRKALRMLRDSNPGLLEWLRSPIIYHSDSFFYERALQLVQQFHSHKSMAHHYTNIAKKHYNLYFKERQIVPLKKYFYVIHPLLCVQHLKFFPSSLPPVMLQDNLKVISPSEVRKKTLLDLLYLKQHSTEGLKDGESIPELEKWIEELFNDAQKVILSRKIHFFFEKQLHPQLD